MNRPRRPIERVYTTEQVAEQTGLSVAEVERIADELGLGIEVETRFATDKFEYGVPVSESANAQPSFLRGAAESIAVTLLFVAFGLAVRWVLL